LNPAGPIRLARDNGCDACAATINLLPGHDVYP
jgi:hypothetical protein